MREYLDQEIIERGNRWELEARFDRRKSFYGKAYQVYYHGVVYL